MTASNKDPSGAPDAPPGSRARPFYGWVIVAVMATASAISMAMGTLNFGLFVRPMGDELEISRATFGWAQSVRSFAGAFTSPWIGRIIDRFGARWLLAGATLVTALAMLALGGVQSGWQMVLLFGVIGLSGFAAPGSLVTNVPVMKWFETKRGRAVAMMSLGVPVGALLLVPLTQVLIDELGWRLAWGVLGIFGAAVIVPLSIVFVRRQPEDMGLRVDGGQPDSGDQPTPPTESWTLADAMRTPTFWALTVVFSLVNLSIGTIGLHRMPAFIDRGIDAIDVALATSLDAILAGLATFGMGMLNERVPSKYLGAFGFLLLALSSVATIYATTTPMMYFAMGVFGLGIGGMMFLQNVVWAEYFGRLHLGAIRGAVMPITLVVGGIGAPLAGYVRDATGSYDIVWWVGATLLFIGGFVVAFTQSPRRRSTVID